MVGDLFVAVFGHVADGDPEVGRGGEVDVVEPDAVAHDRAAAAQTFEVRPVEGNDRAGHDRLGARVERELESLLDVEALGAGVADLEAERLEDRALESDLAVHAVVDHHGDP